MAIEYTRRSGLPAEIRVITEVFDPATQQWIPAADQSEESAVPSARVGFEKITVRPHAANEDGLYRVRVTHSEEG